jgi:NAD(P)-dependent dehydrogenase (short-subunit alcohol dehydrogenase family)
MDLGLTGRNVLMTGGPKGIGRAIADMFAAEGANVAICARDKAEVEAATAALGPKTFGSAVDVSNGPAVVAWVRDADATPGGTPRRSPAPWFSSAARRASFVTGTNLVVDGALTRGVQH